MNDNVRANFHLGGSILRPHAERICQYLLPSGRREGNEWVCGDVHGAPGKSLKVNMQSGRWADFADGDKGGGDLISLWAAVRGCNQYEALSRADAWIRLGDESAWIEKDRHQEQRRKPKDAWSFDSPPPANDTAAPAAPEALHVEPGTIYGNDPEPDIGQEVTNRT